MKIANLILTVVAIIVAIVSFGLFVASNFVHVDAPSNGQLWWINGVAWIGVAYWINDSA